MFPNRADGGEEACSAEFGREVTEASIPRFRDAIGVFVGSSVASGRQARGDKILGERSSLSSWLNGSKNHNHWISRLAGR